MHVCTFQRFAIYGNAYGYALRKISEQTKFFLDCRYITYISCLRSLFLGYFKHSKNNITSSFCIIFNLVSVIFHISCIRMMFQMSWFSPCLKFTVHWVQIHQSKNLNAFLSPSSLCPLLWLLLVFLCAKYNDKDVSNLCVREHVSKATHCWVILRSLGFLPLLVSSNPLTILKAMFAEWWIPSREQYSGFGTVYDFTTVQLFMRH